MLAVALGASGVSTWLAWADYVLLPPLALCLGVIALALWSLRRHAPAQAVGNAAKAGGSPLPNQDHR
ncbi:mercury resistance system transport protein MerF [Paeniroseomonas aquatica]|uniref:Mercury resistance system transport protein MerF n=1 Tax=Paeniroseomonas aquatica TaxID=373043 RepID=A0ABT8A1B1_9PROT|nr:mercury resistance system transport protein MerF [Paeniroseomonas aquatica]MDN3563520.1 mercury resistance system transport protein MerF [Paeniroseomonas aquatica]